jgi:hypothetical protein
MRNLHVPAGLLCMFLLGCKPNLEARIPGSWKLAGGHVVTLAADKTCSQDMGGGFAVTGTWKIDGGDLVMTPEMIGGKPVSELKAQAISRVRSKPMTPKIKEFIDDMDKPNILKLSEDGKTLNTDKARDTNSGVPWALTRQTS